MTSYMRVFGTYEDPFGDPMTPGYLEFVPNARVADGDVILVPETVRVPVDLSGSVDVMIVRATPYGYTVYENFHDSARTALQLPDGVGPVDLRTLSGGPLPRPATAYLPLTGGTMIGAIVLASDASAPLEPAALEQVRTNTGGSNDRYLDHGLVTSGSADVDLSVANTHGITLGSASTILTFEPVVSGRSQSFTLRVRQDSTGGRLLTYPSGVDWGSPMEPLLSDGPGLVDVLVFTTVDGGVHWTGHVAGLGFAV